MSITTPTNPAPIKTPLGEPSDKKPKRTTLRTILLFVLLMTCKVTPTCKIGRW